MPKVVIENQGNIGILRLSNGVSNAISADMVADLSGALREIEKTYDGMVLAGGRKFFSMGFDLPALVEMNRKEFADFFSSFNSAVLALFTIPVPTCCAIGGHAVAGGWILAQACDYRCAVPERKLGLNEIKLGVPVPYLADLILRQLVGDRAATAMLYSGDFIQASDGIDVGLVDEACPQDAVEERAVEIVAGVAAYPRAAFSAIKANRVEALCRRYEADREMKEEEFLDCWCSEGTQAKLREASRKF